MYNLVTNVSEIINWSFQYRILRCFSNIKFKYNEIFIRETNLNHWSVYLEINKIFVTQMVQWTDFLEFIFVLKFTDPDCYDLVHPQGTPRKKPTVYNYM